MSHSDPRKDNCLNFLTLGLVLRLNIGLISLIVLQQKVFTGKVNGTRHIPSTVAVVVGLISDTSYFYNWFSVAQIAVNWVKITWIIVWC